MSKRHVSAIVNGDAVEFLTDPGMTLLDALRDELELTGSKEGCGSGDCGACSVVVDGRLVCSCLMLAAEAEGRRIETIEGMAQASDLHPLQRKFLEHAALQCGFCTPGILVASKALLDAIPIRLKPKSATGWRATFAGAPATTRSFARSWMRPPRCDKRGWWHDRYSGTSRCKAGPEGRRHPPNPP